MTAKRPREIQRRAIGVKVLAGGRAIPHAYLIYRVLFDDGTETIDYGRSVTGVPTYDMLNGPKKARARAAEAHRPDLFTQLLAAAILLNDIEAACAKLDAPTLKEKA